MKIYVNPYKWINSFFEYGIALALMLNCRSMWLEIDTMRTWFPYFVLLILAVSTFGYLFTSGLLTKKSMLNAFAAVVFILVYCEMFQLIHYSKVIQFQRLVFAVCCIVFLLVATKDVLCISDILLKYRNLIVLVSIISLFFWMFGSLLGLISYTGMIKSTWSSTTQLVNVKSYYNIYFEPQNIKAFGILPIMARNCACFTEGPMAALNFSLALIIDVVLDKHNSKKKTIILVIAIISTFSVIGYVIMFSILGYFFISSTSKNILKKLLKMFGAPIVLIIFIAIGYAIVVERLQTSSGNLRIDDFKIGFVAWRNNLIFGNGFENYNILQNLMVGRTSIGFSNSLMQLLSDGGIYFFLLEFIAIIKEIKFCIKNERRGELIFALCFIAMYVTLISTYQYINIFIFGWFLCRNNKKWLAYTEIK